MNKKNTYFALFSIILTVITFIIIKEIVLIINENNSKKRVFNEIKEKYKDYKIDITLDIDISD